MLKEGNLSKIKLTNQKKNFKNDQKWAIKFDR